MAFMSSRDFMYLSLDEMRSEFSKAIDAVTRNAYNRAKDTDPELYKAIWGDKITAKKLEKKLLDLTEENERIRYINGYKNLMDNYRYAYSIESRDKFVTSAKKLFPGVSDVRAVEKFKEQQRYLQDPEVKKILKSEGSEEDEDTVISDLILQYVSNDYKLANAAGVNTGDVALLESYFSSKQDFKNFLLQRVALQRDELRKWDLSKQEIESNPNAKRYAEAQTPEEVAAAWRDYAQDKTAAHWKTGFITEDDINKTPEQIMKEWGF